jgi:hypothetical protein
MMVHIMSILLIKRPFILKKWFKSFVFIGFRHYFLFFLKIGIRTEHISIRYPNSAIQPGRWLRLPIFVAVAWSYTTVYGGIRHDNGPYFVAIQVTIIRTVYSMNLYPLVWRTRINLRSLSREYCILLFLRSWWIYWTENMCAYCSYCKNHLSLYKYKGRRVATSVKCLHRIVKDSSFEFKTLVVWCWTFRIFETSFEYHWSKD